MNLYSYVKNNPIGFTDVFGLAAKAFVKAYDEYLDIKKSVYGVLPGSFDVTFVNLSESEKQEWLSDLNEKRNIARNLHYDRNRYNTGLPKSIEEAEKMNFEEMSANSYHQDGVPEGFKNSKWVGPNGKKEIVFSYLDGSVVKDVNNKGTYNFFAGGFRLTVGDHFKYDVNPWKEWGSGWGDTHSMR